VAAAAAVLTAVAFLLLPDFNAPGLEMDEGTVLAYPSRILDGALPHRDYSTPYGPGGFWFLAGTFELFGASPDVERAVGLFYRLVIVGTIFSVALPARLPVASTCGLVCGTVLLPLDLLASSGIGAIAFGLLGLGVALAAAAGRQWGSERRLPLLAGLALGTAILFRLDFALAVLLGALPPAVALRPPARRWLAGGIAMAVALYVPDVIASWGNLGQLATDATHAADGRRLPIPALSSDLGQLFAAEVLCTALAVAVGGLLFRRPNGSLPGRALLSVGLFAAGMQPWVLSRIDIGHVTPVAALTVGLAPLIAAAIVHLARGGAAGRAPMLAALSAGAGIALLLAPSMMRGQVHLQFDRLLGLGEDGAATVVRRGDRWFPLDRDARPQAVRALLRDVERHSRAGDRLFVGTGDLRRTPYVDTFLYYLLPELEPATFYMEFSPGSANRPGSGLANEIRRADVVILSRRWDSWNERNDSRKFGPAAPNRVVQREFCLRSRHGPYELYRRCDSWIPPGPH
jgi:hypothetical protein